MIPFLAFVTVAFAGIVIQYTGIFLDHDKTFYAGITIAVGSVFVGLAALLVKAWAAVL